jgi:glycosyltransferase involved in cell wall biosynthesis
MTNKDRINHRLQKQSELKDRLRKKIANKQGPKKICLTMIVKNESNNMIRILDSVKNAIDIVSIVDTGSTDNTEEIIIKWGKDNNIPTTVHHEPFKNFSHNRTHSIRVAKQTYPEADYFLLSDADFVWEVNKGGKFDKVLLIDHKYLIEQYNKSLSYWNIRLLSAKVDWECVGVTHEYWNEVKNQTGYSGEIRTSKIKTLVIDDREDGGCKGDKFERDERLLRGGLDDSETPNHLKTRYKFYLAQTMKDMGKHEESIEWYEKRIKDGGWFEEVYYSKYQIGVNHEQLGWHKKQTAHLIGVDNKTPEESTFIQKWDPKSSGPSVLINEANEHFSKAAISYLSAYNYRKVRAEALYHMVRMYRLLGLNDIAFKFATIGKKIKYPEQDTLFIERSCYDYLFDFEISIVAYYLPEYKDIGRQATADLITRTDLPEWISKLVENNSRHYI